MTPGDRRSAWIIYALPPLSRLSSCKNLSPPYFFHGAFAPSFIWRRRPCSRLPVSTVAKDNCERIEYKLLSLTYKVLSTTQPSYLHNLVTVQPPRSTHSSSLVTLARPSTSSYIWITDCSFHCAFSCLWNQLLASPSTMHWSLQFWLTYSYEWHFLRQFHRLTTFIIRHPFTLSF